MNALKLAGTLFAVIALAGCANSKSSGAYTRDQARQEMHVRLGVVESVREVLMEGQQSGAGTFAGAAVGGIAGSHVGGGKGQLIGAILGALAGGMAGATIEDNAAQKNALEITVQLDNGQLIAIVQEADERFNPGEKIRILSAGGTTRVTH